MTKSFFLTFCALLSGCSGSDENGDDNAFNSKLADTLTAKPQPSARAYALIKVGVYGRDWLGTFHGLSDNRAACEETIKPYNDDPELSTLPGEYRCEVVDETFQAPLL